MSLTYSVIEEGALNHVLNSTLILGAAGGVGGAYINMLAVHELASEIIPFGSALLLADTKPIRPLPGLESRYRVMTLEDVFIRDKAGLVALVQAYGITCVVELADIETFDFVEACAHCGISYLSTGYGVWPEIYEAGNEPRARILIRAREIRGTLGKRSYPQSSRVLIGSGMNPGVVNALVEEGLRFFANRRGVSRERLLNDVTHIVFTEEDTTAVASSFTRHQFPMTWNPTHAYEEFTELVTGYLDNAETVWIENAPRDSNYSVWCGDRIISGMLVPHEEVVTAGEKYPRTQVGFVYKIPDVSKQQLSGIEDLALLAPVMMNRQSYDILDGYDVVGVLVQTNCFGSYWFGFKNLNDEARIYNTNATLMQVAAGALAGTATLESALSGLLVVEDTDTASYLRMVEQFLGPATKVDLFDYRFQGFK